MASVCILLLLHYCALFVNVYSYWASFTTGYDQADVSRTLHKTVLNERTLDGVAGQETGGYGVIEMCFAYDSNLHGCKDMCCSSRYDNTQYRLIGIRSYVQSQYGMVDFASIYQLRVDTSSARIYGTRAVGNLQGIHISDTLCNNGDEVQQMQIHEQDGYGILGAAVYCIPVTTAPTGVPSIMPTTAEPSLIPTTQPTYNPTFNPTLNPSQMPSKMPSRMPSKIPSKMPTTIPSGIPTNTHTKRPSAIPSTSPTRKPIENGEVFNGATTTEIEEHNDELSNNNTSFLSEKIDFVIFVLVILILNVLCCFLYYLWRKKRYEKQIELVNANDAVRIKPISTANLISETDGNETGIAITQKNEGENNMIGTMVKHENEMDDHEENSSTSSESDDELFVNSNNKSADRTSGVTNGQSDNDTMYKKGNNITHSN